MEENQNSDFKGKSNSIENSNHQQGGSNYPTGSSNSNSRHGPSNSNSRPSPSNSNSKPGPSNANPRQGSSNSLPRTSTSSNHWQERDPKPPLKKRSHSENYDWGREKLNKWEASDRIKREGDSDNDGTETDSEDSNDNPLLTLDEITAASERKAVASMSQQNQQPMIVSTPQLPQQTHQPMAITMPQQCEQQIMHPQVMPYPSNDYNGTENDPHIDPSQGGFALNPMMPMNSQWPVNHAVPTVTNNVASTSGIGMPMEMGSPSMGAFPHMNISNNDPSPWNGMLPGFPLYPLANNQDAIIPMFNNLELTRAVLTPPLPGEKRTRRQKPNGCRTVFVGNLPEKVTEEIIQEAFQICGPISVIRMSKKNFCHIRFEVMESVDQALLLSGFRIRIDDSKDPAFNGILHVDYAVARDDQHDWETLERARLREERHHEAESYPPSPPPIPNFSEDEAHSLAERLRNEETFREGLQVLITWLDRGNCNKRNSGSFYSLIQSTHSLVKKLRNEKSRLKEEVEKANENLENKNRSIERDINEIVKVFVAAKTQKVWDHFSRNQRKKLEEMKNDTCNLKQTNSEDLVGKRKDEEMELSDSEDRNDSEAEDIKERATEEFNVTREKVFNLTEKQDTCNQVNENYKLREENARLKFELEECKLRDFQSREEIARLKSELEKVRNFKRL